MTTASKDVVITLTSGGTLNKAVLLQSHRKRLTGFEKIRPGQVPIGSRDPCGKGDIDSRDDNK
jgi:hypothetical protein